MMRQHKQTLIFAASVFLAVFALTVPFCGYYLDDFGFILSIKGASAEKLWDGFLHYVPGRNLHIPLFAGLFNVTGGSEYAIHSIGLLIDAFNIVLALLIAIEITGLVSLALPAALIFALMTNHGETHFWVHAIPQNLLSTTAVLGAFLLALKAKLSLKKRLAFSLGIYTLGFFTYDQVCVLWPLLIASACAREKPLKKAFLPASFAAAYCVCLNLIHLGLRYLSTRSDGGRPVLHFGEVFRRVYDAFFSAIKGTIQAPSWGALPHWSLSILLGLAALWLGYYAARRIAAIAQEEQPASSLFFNSTRARLTLAFGLAWFLLAFFPNFFNFISPRHAYLPSFGWALICVVLFSKAYQTWPRARTVLFYGGIFLFANAVVANVHEGSEWRASAAHHRRYLAAVREITPPLENIFLSGGPRYVRRAPVFHLMHDVKLNAKLFLEEPIQEGDIHVRPSHSGVFYFNDLSVWPTGQFFWYPYEKLNLVAYTKKEGYRCVRAIKARQPDETEVLHVLRASPACSATALLDAEVALTSTRFSPPTTRESIATHEGLSLVSAAFSTRPKALGLTLRWRGALPPGDVLAVLPRLYADDGRLIYEPVYRIENLRAAVTWPFAGAPHPLNGRPPGHDVIETYVARTPHNIEPGTYRAELDIYAVSEGKKGRRLTSLQLYSEVTRD